MEENGGDGCEESGGENGETGGRLAGLAGLGGFGWSGGFGGFVWLGWLGWLGGFGGFGGIIGGGGGGADSDGTSFKNLLMSICEVLGADSGWSTEDEEDWPPHVVAVVEYGGVL